MKFGCGCDGDDGGCRCPSCCGCRVINRLFRLCSLRILDDVLRVVRVLVPSDDAAADDDFEDHEDAAVAGTKIGGGSSIEATLRRTVVVAVAVTRAAVQPTIIRQQQYTRMLFMVNVFVEICSTLLL